MLKALAIALTWFLALTTPLFAAGFQLTAIGGMDVTGSAFNEWWYSSQNPTFSGVTTSGSTVTITIDGTDYQAAVEESGSWSFSPTTLTEGDHSVALSSSAGSQIFTLHIGPNIPENVVAPTVSDLPVAGAADQTAWLLLGAVLIFGTGVVLFPVKK